MNYGNICTGLEVLSFLLTVLQPPAVLSSFKPLQRGVAACMTCGNTKVLRAVHSLLSRLMSLFPTEPSTWLWPPVPPSLSFLSAWLGGPGACYWECSPLLRLPYEPFYHPSCFFVPRNFLLKKGRLTKLHSQSLCITFFGPLGR